MSKPHLCFLHIPKTAGTTLWLILQRQYSPERVIRVDSKEELAALTDADRANCQALLGHLPFGLQMSLPQPVSCFTIMREPVNRTLSFYGHLMRTPLKDIGSDFKAEDGSLLSIPDCYLHGVAEMDNYQTRMLAGQEAVDLPFGQCDRDVFEQAKKNLAEGIEVVGITRRFDEFVVLLQRHYHWTFPCYVPENVGTKRPQREETPQDTMELIKKYTQWDQELFACAIQRMDTMIAQEGAAYQKDLIRFQQANIRYQQVKEKVNHGLLCRLKRSLPLRQQRHLEVMYRKLMEIRQPRAL